MLNVPTFELMKLWGELVECYHGVHGYGGNTCQIYAYRFWQASPFFEHGPQVKDSEMGKTTILERSIQAKSDLIQLLSLFTRAFGCSARVGVGRRDEGISIDEWQERQDQFSWRIDIRIQKGER